jgi:hypothetical protein
MIPPELVSRLLLLSLTYAFDAKVWRKLDLSIRQAIYEFSNQYREAFISRHGRFNLIGHSEKISIENTYIPLNFSYIKSSSHPSLECNEYFTSYITHSQNIALQSSYLLSDIECANTHQYLVVYGEVGSGKSTFLKRMGLEAVNTTAPCQYTPRKIPVYVDIKKQHIQKQSIHELIANEFKVAGFPDSRAFTKGALEKGDLLILVDGLDDLEEHLLTKYLYDVHDLVDQYPDNYYIVTRKQLAASIHLNRFTFVQIHGFDCRKIDAFVTNWFSNKNQEIGTFLLKEIKESPLFPRDLCQNPLLLTKLCMFYESQGSMIKNYAEIYEYSLKILLEDWPKYKGFKNYDNLPFSKEEVISYLAFTTFKADQQDLKTQDILSFLQYRTGDQFPEPKLDALHQFLNDLELRHNIIKKKDNGSYTFQFSSLQQYLVAYHFALSKQSIEDLTQEFVLNKKWAKIFILLSCMPDADSLIESILKFANSHFITPGIQQLMEWVEKVTQLHKAAVRDPSKITYALFFLIEIVTLYKYPFRFRISFFKCNVKIHNLISMLEENNQISHLIDPKFLPSIDSQGLIEISISLARRMIEADIFFDTTKLELVYNTLLTATNILTHSRASIPDRQKCLDYLYQAWAKALNIKEELLHLSLEDVRALENYLYIYELLLKCRQTASSLSPRVWLKVEYQLFYFTED